MIMATIIVSLFFFFNDTAPTAIYTYLHNLSLHDALPISQDFDAVDHLRRDAVDPERAVVAGAGHLLAVDQHLGIAAAQAAQLYAVVFHDVGADEGRAGQALDHVAHGIGFEALEVFQVVAEHRRDVGRAVAVGDLGLHDDGVELLGLGCRGD